MLAGCGGSSAKVSAKVTPSSTTAAKTTTTNTAPPGASTVVDITAGSLHTCALMANGTVKCWGDDREGQTSGTGKRGDPQPTAVTVPGITDAVAIQAGKYH